MNTPTTGPVTGEETAARTAPGADPVAEECAVSLRGLTKVFAGTTVVDALDLDVTSGEFFSLLVRRDAARPRPCG